MRALPGALVWDLDGTLIDSAPDIAAALNQLLHEHGRPPHSVARVKCLVGQGVARLIEQGFAAAGAPIGPETAAALAPRFLEIYGPQATRRTRLNAGAAKILAGLAAAGVRHAICTNKPGAVSTRILAAFDILPFFGAVIGGDSTLGKKPDPRPVAAALEALGARPAEAVMIGDSAVDLAAARAAGMRIVLVRSGYGGDDVDTLDADALIDQLDELPEVLRRLPSA